MMTAEQFKAARLTLGLSQSGMADFLGVSLRTSHGYENDSPIPIAVAKLLRLVIRLKLKPGSVK